MRSCSQCEESFERDSFSSNQWAKGAGFSRCIACVHGGGVVRRERPDSSRYNESTRASFKLRDLERPFASGAFRWVAKGVYTNGPRKGKKCVCKWFKSGQVYESTFFKEDILAVERAAAIIQQFNCTGRVKKMIYINRPNVWVFQDGPGRGRKVLQEPFITNWQKFNSNTGWTDNSSPWPRIMQALSHFSYHITSGQLVLCDLQGGVYSDGVVLTDPVILSRTRRYGVTDLGPKGISSFFARHTCNEFCVRSWQKPRDPREYFAAQEGTSMERPAQYVHTRPSRQAFTHPSFQEDDEDY